ncbi:MAG TPA: aminotransferase class V-fold PLP-dependent enzyme, partial [Methanocorpusculum sp.]|nr:aminotransferase class V-fold PLP-dependent enzyme [Methanocorpusculum sp.]
GTEGQDHATNARELLSEFLGITEQDNLIFTNSATDALNMLISGFLDKCTDRPHVLTTALDHNSVLRPLHEYARTSRIQLDIIPFTNTYIAPEDVERAIRPNTKLMVMTHASNVLGSVQNIKTIGELLHDYGIFFIVDGAQTAGHVPISLKDLPIDAFVFTGHKGLFGISGTGGFYLRDQEAIEPIRFGGTGTDSLSLLHPRKMPERFEAGTHNYPGLAALAAGIAFLKQEGNSVVFEKEKRQTKTIIAGLANTENIIIYNKNPDLPIISVNIRGIDNETVGFILSRAYNVIVRTGLHCAPLVHKTIDNGQGCIRLSLSYNTTDAECETAVYALLEVAEHAHPSVYPA